MSAVSSRLYLHVFIAILAVTAIFLYTVPAQAESTPAPDQFVYVVVASRSDLASARALAKAMQTAFPATQIFRTGNGQYAITMGAASPPQAKKAMKNLIAKGLLPADSYISEGRLFLEEFQVTEDDQSSTSENPPPAAAPKPAPGEDQAETAQRMVESHWDQVYENILSTGHALNQNYVPSPSDRKVIEVAIIAGLIEKKQLPSIPFDIYSSNGMPFYLTREMTSRANRYADCISGILKSVSDRKIANPSLDIGMGKFEKSTSSNGALREYVFNIAGLTATIADDPSFCEDYNLKPEPAEKAVWSGYGECLHAGLSYKQDVVDPSLDLDTGKLKSMTLGALDKVCSAYRDTQDIGRRYACSRISAGFAIAFQDNSGVFLKGHCP